MGTHLMFLSNSDVGKDLAEQRSDIYVDRVRNRPMVSPATLALTHTFSAPVPHGQGTVRVFVLQTPQR